MIKHCKPLAKLGLISSVSLTVSLGKLEWVKLKVFPLERVLFC